MSDARHPYLQHVGPIAFAHRGGTSVAPENSLRAFQDAVDLGYQYVETDVHATADGVLVAFHDDDLKRTCGEDLAIATSTWDRLSSARIDGTDPIPLMEDLLGSWPELRINIDCKSEGALEPLVNTIKRTNSLDRVCIGSFSDSRLQRIRTALGKGVCTSMGPKEVAKFVSASTLKTPFHPDPTIYAAQVPVKQSGLPVVTERSVALAHKLDIQVHVWTIDDPIEIARLLDLGVDGVMSDDTRALRDVFAARGFWH
jgi:glycerophosphoryl diester phosphodiesterase